MKLKLQNCGDDWYTIERANHENKHDLRPLYDTEGKQIGSALWYSGRISDADVEGTGEEMQAIADAIENRASVGFKRCAVKFLGSGEFFLFWSPRNSQEPAVVPVADADDLAREIRARFYLESGT